MAIFNARTGIMAGLALLAGCTMLPPQERETIGYYLERDWDSVTARPREVFATVEPWQTDHPEEVRVPLEQERQRCVAAGGEERVMMQDGVNDGMKYHRCVFSPYGKALGMRMHNRPEPQR